MDDIQHTNGVQEPALVKAQALSDQYKGGSVHLEIMLMCCRRDIQAGKNFKDNLIAIEGYDNKQLKIHLLRGLRETISDRLGEQESLRHEMRKKSSQKQYLLHNSRQTTAACSSITSASVSDSATPELPIPISTLTSLANSICQNDINFSRSSVQTARFEDMETLKTACCELSESIKVVERDLIPLKNERNFVSENLEDVREDLTVAKTYLKDLTIDMESKKKQCIYLMARINSLSKNGHFMQNRENMTASLNSTRIMNSTFVDEAKGKLKAVKDFLKGKLGSSSSPSGGMQDSIIAQFSYGSQSSRANTQTNLPQASNKFLDFNY